MKTATTPYIQEEQRRFGAVPKIKAEIRPFDFDFGLGPGLGTFVNCSCPASGELLLNSGYVTSGSWTSEILQTYMGQLTAVIPSCLNLSNYNSSSIYLTHSGPLWRREWFSLDSGGVGRYGAPGGLFSGQD